MSHKVSLTWIGGEHTFALGIGELRALQTATNAGPEELLHRMAAKAWRVDDLVEILRLGLIGGGEIRDPEAGRLVVRLADLHGWIALREPAFRVLARALTGPEDDNPGERPGPTAGPANGGSAPSTA